MLKGVVLIQALLKKETIFFQNPKIIGITDFLEKWDWLEIIKKCLIQDYLSQNVQSGYLEKFYKNSVYDEQKEHQSAFKSFNSR